MKAWWIKYGTRVSLVVLFILVFSISLGAHPLWVWIRYIEKLCWCDIPVLSWFASH